MKPKFLHSVIILIFLSIQSYGLECPQILDPAQILREKANAILSGKNIGVDPFVLVIELKRFAGKLTDQNGYGDPDAIEMFRLARELKENPTSLFDFQTDLPSQEIKIVLSSETANLANKGWKYKGALLEKEGEFLFIYDGSYKKFHDKIVLYGTPQDIISSAQSVTFFLRYLQQSPDVVPETGKIKFNVHDAIGDLQSQEIKQIQDIVNELKEPLFVVGSAAKGERRNPGTDLPMVKGAHGRSDIDYLTPFPIEGGDEEKIELLRQLPAIDMGEDIDYAVFEDYLEISEDQPAILFVPKSLLVFLTLIP